MAESKRTEIIPQNILMTTDDDSMFQRAEKEELANPSVPVVVQTHSHPHPIYRSRGLPRNLHEASGHSLLADFGSARLLNPSTTTEGWWMPDTYRAPEVLMGVPWDHGVDVWSIGVMVLGLLEGKSLFYPIDEVHGQYVLPLALAQYMSYMGPPPLHMIQKSANPVIATFFDEKGTWIADPPIQKTSFEDFVTVIEPGEEKTLFLNFIRKIFTWDPRSRANSAELFEDEWLTAPFKVMGILE
nr:putative serine/threonine-protein kinase dyrk2 [Quercus suber]